MICRDFVELTTDLLEGALDPDTEARATTHLGGCPDCARYLEQIRWTIVALGAMPDGGVGGARLHALRDAFRERSRP